MEFLAYFTNNLLVLFLSFVKQLGLVLIGPVLLFRPISNFYLGLVFCFRFFIFQLDPYKFLLVLLLVEQAFLAALF